MKRRIMRMVPKNIRKALNRFLFPKYVFEGSLFSPMTGRQQSPMAALSMKGPWRTDQHISITSRSFFGKKIRGVTSVKPDRVVASVYGNFGNQVFEAACAAYVSKSLGVNTMTVRDSGVFRVGRHDLGGVTMVAPHQEIFTPTLSSAVKASLRPNPEKHLSGAFFLNWVEEAYQQDDKEMAEIYLALGRALSFSLEGESFPSDHLTVSFRGGDAFSARPLTHFGQPPLSYYQLVASDSRWAHVRVVSDDKKNPALEPFVAWLERQRISHEYLNQDWLADVATIYSSKAVLASRGTFAPAIASISPHVDELFFFEDPRCPIVSTRLRIVHDQVGGFSAKVLSDNWQATPEQVELILGYPEENLLLS